MFRSRKTDRLRLGRVSLPGGIYFITTCTASRRPLFASPANASTAKDTLESLATTQDVTWIAGTVMPDHLHAVFELGQRLSLDRVVAKLKGNITRALGHGPGAMPWQENAFEYHLRPTEEAESHAFYIFMNPYVAGLCPVDAIWPWWVCTSPARFKFLAQRRDNGCPQPEWVKEAEMLARHIVLRPPYPKVA